MNRTRNRLADLLLNPQESLDVEYKRWVELAGNDQHKALCVSNSQCSRCIQD